MDWAENDRLCTAVIFGRPWKPKREEILIEEPPSLVRIEYRDRIVEKPVVEYRDRVVVKEVPVVQYRDRIIEVPARVEYPRIEMQRATAPPGYRGWLQHFKPGPQPNPTDSSYDDTEFRIRGTYDD